MYYSEHATNVLRICFIYSQRLEARNLMFGNFKRHDDRKQRLSSWFAHERDGDMQALDLHGVAAGMGLYLSAVQRDRVLRRSTKVAPRVA
jgi:hypothetical protein